MAADQQLLDALAALWRIPRPGPTNLLSAPAFVALSELCDRRYSRGKATFALSSALRSLGLPCGLPLDQAGLALDLPTAAAALDAAYSRRITVRRHICPLDLADDLPPMSFGNTRIAQFTAEELGKLFDAPRLARTSRRCRWKPSASHSFIGWWSRRKSRSIRGRSHVPPRLCSRICARTSARSNPIMADSRRRSKAHSFSYYWPGGRSGRQCWRSIGAASSYRGSTR